jgi:hypothetical protein
MSGTRNTDWLILRRQKSSSPKQGMPLIRFSRSLKGLAGAALAHWLFLRPLTLPPQVENVRICHGLDSIGWVTEELFRWEMVCCYGWALQRGQALFIRRSSNIYDWELSGL